MRRITLADGREVSEVCGTPETVAAEVAPSEVAEVIEHPSEVAGIGDDEAASVEKRPK